MAESRVHGTDRGIRSPDDMSLRGEPSFSSQLRPQMLWGDALQEGEEEAGHAPRLQELRDEPSFSSNLRPQTLWRDSIQEGQEEAGTPPTLWRRDSIQELDELDVWERMSQKEEDQGDQGWEFRF